MVGKYTKFSWIKSRSELGKKLRQLPETNLVRSKDTRIISETGILSSKVSWMLRKDHSLVSMVKAYKTGTAMNCVKDNVSYRPHFLDNRLPLKHFTDGQRAFQIEAEPGTGPKYVQAPGTSAKITGRITRDGTMHPYLIYLLKRAQL
eukprot:TRINITY_DN741_c0_g2::TRINITY_DN741_c0_g2_i1::g.18404::m.18404 TRINITY_DN741_c0_g2::TRINITY_DN741_c0_g2_i1::g.18404  ORF type:complete len:147 (+),score=8.55,Ribosomal_L2_C/PF03947.13/1.1e+03,Ribosomal_L2_C/PF03947.13/0.0071 TRINITY_DN741_c0_g2_i1:58-498(+)